MAFCCDDMAQYIRDTQLVHYSDVFDEYGISFHDDASVLLIQYCPWCGRKLPDSKRGEWFEELEQLGYDEPLSRNDLPAAYQCAKWRADRE
ncbi:MAG: hypothetical protein IJW14_02430 [Oscillospiraceae bacterium]|nr:hypothetical protein [Oscillospiraceae bacterium]